MKRTSQLIRLVTLLLAVILCIPGSPGLAEAGAAFDEARLNAYLNQLASTVQNPWEKAIYQAGVENLTAENELLTFYLRSFLPDMKQLPSQKTDPAEWLAAFLEGAAAHQMAATLTLENGIPNKKSENKLKADVRNAANKAKQTYAQQAVSSSLMDLFFPEPFKDKKALDNGIPSDAFARWCDRYQIGEEDQPCWAGYLSAQSQRKLNVNNGPHNLELTIRSPESEKLLEGASAAMLGEVSRIPMANVMDTEMLMGYFAKALRATAASLRKANPPVKTYRLDIDDMVANGSGSDYLVWLNDYMGQRAFGLTVQTIRSLPDYPAQDYPKNGWLSGSTSGTKLIIKAPADEFARYVQIRDSDSDAVLVTLFLRPGGTATVRARQGNAYMLVARGTTWYGEEAFFGDEGNVYRTEDIEIYSPRYYHRFDLQLVDHGTTRLWKVDPDALSK